MTPERRRTVESLCLEALEKGEASRAAFLEAMCGADAELRREVESLLGVEGQGSGFLETPAWLEPAVRLDAGARLGPYVIDHVVGTGGMGEVYKAHDTRLGRAVAIKVLPALLSLDLERRARFEREARAVSALDHPNICTLHDIGSASASETPGAPVIDYLVLEFLEGPTLAERLRKGPLPPRQAIEYAIAIAEALAAAHRRGIVHRDLKPPNVILTKAGVKLVDFGLARLGASADAAAIGHSSPPDPSTATTRVGTLHYMAPEQLEGGAVDARADIWALGIVLYEMVTGRRAFEGETSQQVIRAILEGGPAPLLDLQPSAPAPLAGVVARCLAKEPEQRWDSAHDVALQLSSMLSIEPVRVRRGRGLAWSMAVVAVAIVVVGVMWLGRRPSAPATSAPMLPVKFSVVADARPPTQSSYTTLAISPTGNVFVFRGNRSTFKGGLGPATMFARHLDSDALAPIADTQGVLGPFLSPDGRWLAFFNRGKLWKMPIAGGPAQQIADAPSGRGGVWRDDGTIFLAPTFSGPIVQVSADGGGFPRPVTTLQEGETSHRYPSLTPDGDVLLFTARRASGLVDAHEIHAVRLSTGERRVVLRGGAQPQYVPSGHLAFARATTLMAVGFDVRSMSAVGNPVPVVEGVDFRWEAGVSDFGVSRNGTLVYLPTQTARAELVRVLRDGSQSVIPVASARFRAISVAPDGRRAAVVIDNGDRTELDIVDLESGSRTPFSRDYREEVAVWSRDGTRIYFSSSRTPAMGLFWASADPPHEPHAIRAEGDWRFLTSVAPDSRTVFYGDVSPKTGWDIWSHHADVERGSHKLLGSADHETFARLSPDGRMLAFVAGAVHVVRYPELSGGIDISPWGTEPVWASPREIFYRTQDAVLRVPIQYGKQLKAGTATEVFRATLIARGELARSYDVLPNGRAFVIVRAIDRLDRSTVKVVQNWSEELRQKVPGR